MDYLDLIIKIASGITALGVIITLAVKFLNKLNEVRKSINEFKVSTKKLEDHTEENYMSILRLVIMSSEMPIGERINAGYKYLENDGNGEVKAYLKEKFNITKTVDEAPHYKK
jgi:hypothetical protein